jgi:hypothetical protein
MLALGWVRIRFLQKSDQDPIKMIRISDRWFEVS